MLRLTVPQFLALPAEQIYFKLFLSCVKNALFWSGAVTLSFYMFPSLQLRSFSVESVIGLNLWRLSNLPKWLGNCVLPQLVVGMISKYAFPALKSPGRNDNKNCGFVAKFFKTIFRFVGGRGSAMRKMEQGIADDGLNSVTSWQHLTTLYFTWLPAISYYKWLSFLSIQRSFFYFVKSAESGTDSPVDDIRRILTPEVTFIHDFGGIMSDKLMTVVRNRLIPAMLGEPIVANWNNFARSVIAQLLACTVAYAIVSYPEKLPDFIVRSWYGTPLFSIKLNRQLPLLQSLIQSIFEQLFDKCLSTWIPLFPTIPSKKSIDVENLTPEEELLVSQVVQTFGVKGSDIQTVIDLTENGFQSPSLTASRRVTLCTVLWATDVLAVREKNRPLQDALIKYKDQLRRINCDLEDSIVVRQDTINVEHSLTATMSIDSATDVCAVCLSKLLDDQDLVEVVHCHHRFHSDCISRWLLQGTRCPCCRFDLSDGREAIEHDVDEMQVVRDVDRVILERLDELQLVVPHLYDYEEWGVVRQYCVRNGISCNSALSLYGDDTPVNQVTWIDVVISPIVFMLDGYNPILSLARSDYIQYVD